MVDLQCEKTSVFHCYSSYCHCKLINVYFTFLAFGGASSNGTTIKFNVSITILIRICMLLHNIKQVALYYTEFLSHSQATALFLDAISTYL